MTTLAAVKRIIIERLERAGIERDEALQEAGFIVEHVTTHRTAQQILHAQDHLRDEDERLIEEIISRRERREPLQYCLGYAWFMGEKFAVESGVFIPRTDTETIVAVAKEKLLERNLGSGLIAEIGIGSGAISISLLKQLPELKVVAFEISDTAFRVASANAKALGVSDRLNLIKQDWQTAKNVSVDAVVSNPPYIPRWQKETMQPEVADYEPELALFGGGEDGLDFYRACAKSARDWLRSPRGFVVLEVGDGQAPAVLDLFRMNAWQDCDAFSDVNGLSRAIFASAQ
jgi:release factor glutamine methyltransferase